jgi:F-type H+-transporting ATPase subunit gamma
LQIDQFTGIWKLIFGIYSRGGTMAENLFLLKRRIKTAKNIAQIAKAMEMVSASKIKRAQTIVEKNRAYSEKITTLTENIIKRADLKKFSHPYLTTSNSEKKLLIAFSPDKGLCGSLNTNLYKALLEKDLTNTTVVAIGRKMEMMNAKLATDMSASYLMGTSIPHYSVVYQLIQLIEQFYTQNPGGIVEVLYTRFDSLLKQSITTARLLPLSQEISSQPVGTAQELDDLPFLVEPDINSILTDLLPYYVEVKLYDLLMNSYTSEQAARMVAMQNAKNNAKDVAEFLTLTYNKNRQEKITNEILDLANTAN